MGISMMDVVSIFSGWISIFLHYSSACLQSFKSLHVRKWLLKEGRKAEKQKVQKKRQKKTFFFKTKSLKFGEYFALIVLLSQVHYISSAQRPYVASGHLTAYVDLDDL